MNRLDTLTEQFRFLYEKFLNGCDAVEELGKWNKDEYGEMDSYYTNDLCTVVIRIIAVDGNVSKSEVKYLNDNFGFSYSVSELTEVYASCRDRIDEYFDTNFADGIAYMRSINAKLSEVYAEMLRLICDIIIESDTVIADKEMKIVNKLKAIV